jgi:hypothetical protein
MEQFQISETRRDLGRQGLERGGGKGVTDIVNRQVKEETCDERGDSEDVPG